MTVHIALLIYTSFVGAFIYRKRPYTKDKKKSFLFLTFLAIWLIQALRGESVGLDTDQYTLAFIRVRYGRYSGRWEFLFSLLMKILSKSFESPQILFIISSFLIISGIFIFIYYNVDDWKTAFWPVFLFIVLTQYFSTMNLIRQSLAMAVGCNVYTVLRRNQSKNRFIISAVLIALATLFHSSGLVCALLVLPFVITIKRKTIVVGTFVTLGILNLFPYVLRGFLMILPRYSRYIGGRLDTAGSSGVYNLIGLIEFLIIVFCLLCFDPEKEENKEVYRLSFVILFSLALIIMQRRISLAMRLGYYFELFLILLIPEFVQRWNVRLRLPLKMGIYLLGWAYFIYQMTVSSARGCVPYVFFWQ